MNKNYQELVPLHLSVKKDLDLGLKLTEKKR